MKTATMKHNNDGSLKGLIAVAAVTITVGVILGLIISAYM